MNWSRSKYKAVKTTIDGITFDSKKEAKRYTELRLLEKAGHDNPPRVTAGISNHNQWGKDMQIQGRLPVLHRSRGRERNNEQYYNSKGEWQTPTLTGDKEGQIVEDVKGFKTPIYRLKKKLVEACFPGTQIKEV